MQQEYTSPIIGDHISVLSEMHELSGVETMKLKRLSEDKHISISNRVMDSMLDTVQKQFKDDPILGDVLKTKGDITVIKKYSDMEDSLNALLSLYASSRGSSLPREILDLEVLHNYLLKNKSLFKKAFDLNLREVEFFYASLCLTLFHTVALCIIRTVKYVKDGEMHRTVLSGSIDDPVVMSNLTTVTRNIRSGKVDEFLKTALKEGKSLREFVIPTAIGLALWVVWNIRDMVYYFFTARKKVSIWFDSYAVFLEMHAVKTARTNKGAAKKQLNIAKKFHKIASTFDVEMESHSKRVVKQLKKMDNNELVKDGNEPSGSTVII